MPIIIKLRGIGNSGKTTTLKLLIQELINQGAKQLARGAIVDSPGDEAAELEFNGKKIGIITAGDYAEFYDKGLKLFPDYCDILVFACRTRGDTTDWIDSNYANDLRITFEKMAIWSSGQFNALQVVRQKANEAQVKELIELIKQL